MSAPDRYSYPVECKACKVNGKISVSENASGYGTLDPVVENIEGPFLAETVGQRVHVTCKTCGAIVSQ